MVSTWMVVFAMVAGQLVAPPLGPGVEDIDVSQWLAALGVTAEAGTTHSRERLIVVGRDGRVVRIVEGQAGRVDIGLDLIQLMAHPESALTLVHNHPAGNGLSPNDLEHLEYPGVRAVVAIGHDGSIYKAARGSRFPAGPLVGAGKKNEVYGTAHTRAIRALAFERSPISRAAFDAHMYHVLSAALEGAGVLDYQARLGASRQATFDEARPFLTRVHNAARAAAAR